MFPVLQVQISKNGTLLVDFYLKFCKEEPKQPQQSAHVVGGVYVKSSPRK